MKINNTHKQSPESQAAVKKKPIVAAIGLDCNFLTLLFQKMLKNFEIILQLANLIVAIVALLKDLKTL